MDIKVFQLYSNGTKKKPVQIIFSNDVALAELWPSHATYIKESPHLQWVVPTEQGSVVMRSSASGHLHTHYFIAFRSHH